VIPHPDIGDACKVLLLVIATKMTDAGYLAGMKRETLAEMLSVHPRRIAERIDTAKRHQLLTKVAGGYHGRTAEYVATMPPKRAARQHPSTRKVAGERHPRSVTLSPGKSGAKGDAQQHTNTRALTTASRERDDNKRDSRADHITEERSDEEVAADSPLAAVLRLDRPQSGAGA
jgi:hypothetical protein